jgi:hypothetical protein
LGSQPDASLAPVGADETEGEMAGAGHVFGSVRGSITRQVIVELDIERPVHALHPPMSADGASHAFDIEGCG